MSNRNRRRRPPQHDGHSKDLATSRFQFEHKGQVYVIPPARTAAREMSAGAVIDAVMDPDKDSQLRVGLTMLEAAKPSPETWAALRDMSMERFGTVIGKWMKTAGVTPGKSEGSSNSSTSTPTN